MNCQLLSPPAQFLEPDILNAILREFESDYIRVELWVLEGTTETSDIRQRDDLIS